MRPLGVMGELQAEEGLGGCGLGGLGSSPLVFHLLKTQLETHMKQSHVW